MAIQKVPARAIDPSASSANLNIDAGTLYLDATNNRVGVANTSPANTLHVIGPTGAYASRIGVGASGAQLFTNYVLNDGVSPSGVGQTQSDGTGFMISATSYLQLGLLGVEKVRIDSSGNIQIGTTTDSIAKLVVRGSNGTGSPVVWFGDSGANYTGFSVRPIAASFVTLLSSEWSSTATSLGFAIGGTEKARLSTSGTLAINNTSPESTVKLQVSGANNGGALVLDLINNNAQSARMNAGNTNNMLILRSAFNDNPPAYGNSGAKWGITFLGGSQSGSYSAVVDTAALGKSASIYAMSEDGSAGYNRAVGLSLYTCSFDQNQAERLRISADGTVRVGGYTGTFTGGNGWLTSSGDNVKAAISAKVTSNGYWGAAWHNASDVNVGTIVINSTGTAYNTSSDYRLKTSVEPMTGALARVALLKPCTYTWISDNSAGEGFIAHELAEVCPHAVTGEKDAIDTYLDEEGNEQTRPRYQGIDTSFLVATLTAAIQEQQTIIAQLQADVAELKAK